MCIESKKGFVTLSYSINLSYSLQLIKYMYLLILLASFISPYALLYFWSVNFWLLKLSILSTYLFDTCWLLCDVDFMLTLGTSTCMFQKFKVRYCNTMHVCCNLHQSRFAFTTISKSPTSYERHILKWLSYFDS